MACDKCNQIIVDELKGLHHTVDGLYRTVYLLKDEFILLRTNTYRRPRVTDVYVTFGKFYRRSKNLFYSLYCYILRKIPIKYIDLIKILETI